MDQTGLVFPQGNDVVVEARFPDISDGTGQEAKLYTKDDRNTPDTDPTTMVYMSSVFPDPDNVGATMASFDVPESDTQVPGAYWWRVDVVDTLNKKRTANCGTLLVEAV